MFASEPIPPRRVVIEYRGEWITPEQVEYRSLRPRSYLFQLRDGPVIDGIMGGSGAEFINHSCDPNLRFRVWRRRVFLVSLREIPRGEELTVDYQFTEDETGFDVCRCGAANCRWRTGARELVEAPPE